MKKYVPVLAVLLGLSVNLSAMAAMEDVKDQGIEIAANTLLISCSKASNDESPAGKAEARVGAADHHDEHHDYDHDDASHHPEHDHAGHHEDHGHDAHHDYDHDDASHHEAHDHAEHHESHADTEHH